jgi:hypothetical protein
MVSTNLLRFLSALVALAVSTATVVAADSTKIDRRIAKEPVYQSGSPKYCLLVFGAEAKTRVWLVLDGDTLYVDRNANGDLTEENEQIKRNGREFEAGEIAEPGGKAKYAHVRLRQLDRPEKELAGLCIVSVEVTDRYLQYGSVRFADRPQDAPRLHFDGPLTMGLRDPDKQTLARGDAGSQINAWIGTPDPGKGKGPAVMLDHSKGVPSDIHPVVSIEFPNKDPNGRPIKITAGLTQRC